MASMRAAAMPAGPPPTITAPVLGLLLDAGAAAVGAACCVTAGTLVTGGVRPLG